MHDFAIRNTLILDGLGGQPYLGSLAVSCGKIAEVGIAVGTARETIDAGGLALAPGIIDGHTHYDAQITWDPFADPSPQLGVTTIVMGNCGFTIAPCRPADRDLTMRNLTHVEGMSLDALRAGICWDFESFPEYLDMLERSGVGPNVGVFLGHSSVRTYVLGDDASRRPASEAEIEKMAKLVREAMAAGAIGFSTTTNEPHNGENGIPMPSRLADNRELQALATAMGESGNGLIMLTRGQGMSMAEVEELAAASGRPVRCAGFLHNPANPTRVFSMLEDVAAARSRGRQVFAEVSCCPLTMEFTLKQAYVFEGFPAWKPAMEAHGDALRRVYADPAFREAVKQDLKALHGMRGFNSEWNKLHVVEVARNEHAALEGRSIQDLAAEKGLHPLDVMIDLALSEDLDTLFTAVMLNEDETAVGRLIGDPNNFIGLSDAGAHLTFLCDAGFGLHLLGHWVRESGAMSLPEAIRRLTSHPAQILGIGDRGRLSPGFAADLFLFDPATIGRGPKHRLHDLPTGATRLVTPARGIYGVWVNGTRVVDDAGSLCTQTKPGRVLRSFMP